nr:porin family protein [uncultured Gellertiella sp.]
MRKFVVSLMASSVAALTFAAAAHAADAIDSVPEAPQAYDQPVSQGNWGGAYAGGAASYNFGRFNDSTFDNHAVGGQLYGGYNVQQGQLVYGGEADIGYSGNDDVNNGVKAKQGVNGSIRGRLGVEAGPVLVYGTAGLAATRLKGSDATSSDTRNSLGVTAGAGVETMVTDTISARAEYRYSDYQDKNFNLASGTANRGYDEHSIKLGVGVKF